MFKRVKTQQYVSDIKLSPNQDKFLVKQVLEQFDKFYSKSDLRKIVLEAFTGSGKTTVIVKQLIPKVIEKYNVGTIGFISPKSEVVGASYDTAKKTLDGKIVDGKLVRVYNQTAINLLKADAARGYDVSLDGDVNLLFLTAQYFYYNYDFLVENGKFDMMVVDEAHIMFGTINKEDTKDDKGVHMENFNAWTLGKLYELEDCATLFLTATPTKSQKMLTGLGTTNNVYLNPMPRDMMTTPFFEMVSYLDFEDTLFKGLDYFKQHCDDIANLITAIDNKTWQEASANIIPTYPVVMIRGGRSGAKNGIALDKYIDEIREKCQEYGFKLFISTSDLKELDGKKVSSLDEGVRLASKICDAPVVLVVIETGTAGLDYVKMNNVIIARTPSTIVHNNWSQTAGRSARMKFNFRNHAEAVDAIRGYNISDAQKQMLAEYYILHSTSTVHVPVDSDVLNIDVKEFIETDTFRFFEGRKYILENIFTDGLPTLRHKTLLENDSYKRYRKNYCEECEVMEDGNTQCFHTTWKGFESLTGIKLSLQEMKMLWPMCLHGHHMDGNHFNPDPANVKTLCPNVHSLVTMKNEDYLNRYDELRETLKGIAKKKHGNPHMVDMCFV